MNKIERNKSLVLEAMTALLRDKDPLAVGRFYAPEYIQHNPGLAQGREALAKLIAQLPEAVCYETGLVIAEGNYVAIHGRIIGWASNPQIVVDIFRVDDDGRLAEHWDVLQDEVLEKGSNSGISMFSPFESVVQSKYQLDRTSDFSAEDYQLLLISNLTRVFGERNAEHRLVAIRELYAEDAVLNEPHTSVIGHEAINAAVSALLDTLPANFIFSAVRPAEGHHGLGRLHWRSGPAGGPVAATGTDIARCEGGLIRELTVFLDPFES